MSDAVYGNVIRTESERLEMMVAIYESAHCVRDHDFRTETNTHQPLQRTGSDGVKNKSSSAAVVCLVLLCVLLLTAVIVLCVHIYTNNSNYTEETHQLLTMITNLTEERNQILTKINNLTKEKDQLLTNLNDLTEERNQILTNNTNLIQQNKKLIRKNELLKCLNKTGGWTHYQSSYYYISSEKKSWTESRRYCTEREADLIIINNRQEQNFFKDISEVWIGLTAVEGKWEWVDGSTLTPGFSFWASGEPNGNGREKCVLSYSSSRNAYLSGWKDYPCYYVSKWICEKKILK
ncbi:hepatic lectin-like [Labeo rohita]|uniref:hepatic lectin-like n=1 Tax=Labeo rohita TaxID=84645 RepID=UPI0021E23096|nr:hepatic lectin-like [Labeo rohita]